MVAQAEEARLQVEHPKGGPEKRAKQITCPRAALRMVKPRGMSGSEGRFKRMGVSMRR